MLSKIYASSAINYSIFHKKLELALNPTQKRIILIAALAFTSLAILYTAITCYRRMVVKVDEKKNPGDSKAPVKDQPGANLNPAVKQTKDDDKTAQSQKSFLEAMELMFQDRLLQWGKWIDLSTLSRQQIKERHEKLKKAIEGILPQDINCTTDYRDGMNERSQTLLLQAIMNIQDPAKRLEIVQILLDKGADTELPGFHYAPVYPLHEAELTNDQQLIDLIANAIVKKRTHTVN